MLNITYIGHSGFLVETETVYLLFDYYTGAIPQMDPKKKLFVFASHVHHDHYNREILSLREEFPHICYVLSDDICQKDGDALVEDLSDQEDILFVKPDEEYDLSGCRIRTLRSNDIGVAFVVCCDGKTIYHAGDLNWWHWEGEPEQYNKGMKLSYQTEIGKLGDEKIDAAFVPVDPRLGDQYCLGIDYFMRNTETRKVFPMHFWRKYRIFDRLSQEECTEGYRDKIMRIEREGQTFAC